MEKVLLAASDVKKHSKDTQSTKSSVGNIEIDIPLGKTQELFFDVERGAFEKSEASAKALDMALTFNFN